MSAPATLVPNPTPAPAAGRCTAIPPPRRPIPAKLHLRVFCSVELHGLLRLAALGLGRTFTA
jgi:hypothetical protein